MIGGEETGKQIQATGEDIVAEYMLTMHAWELEGERGMIWTKYLLTVHGRWREGLDLDLDQVYMCPPCLGDRGTP